tara:strand:+ start:2033 stop:3028 length:996 start_codon:yes stop_codon:yes gene_type:complete
MNKLKIFKLLQLTFAFIAIALLSCNNSKKKVVEAETIAFESSTQFFKLSLAQWSFHKAIRDDKTLSNLDFSKKAKELGFEGVEYVSQLYKLTEGNEQESLDSLVVELKKRSVENGIQNVLIMIDHEGDLSVSDNSARDEAIRKHSMWVDAAADLGCSSVRVNLFGGEAEKTPEIWHANSVDGLRRLATYAATKNINVIVENHGGLSSDAGKLTAVLKEINMDNCGALPDFGNFCLKREGGERYGTPCIEHYDIYKGVTELMPYAKGVSAKTFDFDADGNEVSIDYLKMMKIVKESGFTGFVGVEYEGDNLTEEAGILATKELLLKVVKELN